MTASVVAVVAATLRTHGWDENGMRCACGDGDTGKWDYCQDTNHAQHVAEVVVEAQREAATITTVEQLDALPAGAAVRSHGGVSYERARTPYCEWYSTALSTTDGSAIGLPALLLWHPGWVAVDGITPKCWCGHSDDEHATDECACTCAPAVGGEPS